LAGFKSLLLSFFLGMDLVTIPSQYFWLGLKAYYKLFSRYGFSYETLPILLAGFES
jgi:hypothetical protein